MPYSPSTLTAKSIHTTCSKVTPNLTSDIYTSTTTINIQPKHQPNVNIPRNIPKLMDLKFSSNHTPTSILSSSTSSKSSSIRSIDNSLMLVLEHLPSEVNYNFIVSLIDYIKLSHSYITSASFITSTAILRFTNIFSRDICFSSLLNIPPYSNLSIYLFVYYLPDSTRLLCKILYHALKQKLTPISYKVFFNNRSQTFELRDTNNPLSYPPFLIPESDQTNWFDSFDHYKKSFINNSSSQA